MTARTGGQLVASGMRSTPADKDVGGALNSFMAMFRVIPIRDSRLVDLVVKNLDPEKAAELANLWARIYINQNLEEKLSASSQAVDWLTEKVEEMHEKVKVSEFALQKY